MEFTTRWLLDRQAGGIFSATDATGQHVLTTDKHLPDQASTVLALVESGTDDDVRVAVEGLLRLQDRQGHPGFAEFTDRYWQPYPSGRVRTVRYQFHGAAALLAAAHRLDVDEYRVRALDLLHRCFGLMSDGQFPSRLTEDWRGVVEEAPTPQTAVSALRALAVAHGVGEMTVDPDALHAIAERLIELVEVSPEDRPLPEFRRCGANARLALALAHAGRMLETDEHPRAAARLLTTVLERFGDPEDGLLWDRLAPDGTVHVDWVEAPQRGESPFPVKRAADAAQLLVAGRLLESCGIPCPDVIDRATAMVRALTDLEHGGVCLGIGYHWATAKDPAAPTVRLQWTPPRQPGSMVHGGLRDIALSQKSAHTQMTVARADAAGDRLARERGTAVEPSPAGRPRVRLVAPPPRSAPPAALAATVDATVPLPFDRDGFARSLLGGSLTGRGDAAMVPPPAPTRRPIPWHLAAAFHTIAGLRLLGEDHPRIATLAQQIRATQNPDGGFGSQPGDGSEVVSTYFAVLALHLAGTVPARSADAVQWLRGCQDADGAFGPVPGLAGDVWHTGLAVAALRALDAGPAEMDACVEFLLANRLPDGRYANRAGRQANVVVTRRAVAALQVLDIPVPDPETTAAWIRRCQLPGGGFTHRPGFGVSLLATEHAVAALALLGTEPLSAPACLRWLASQQNPDGQFGCHDNLPASTADSFACVQSIAVLRGATARDWTVLVG